MTTIKLFLCSMSVFVAVVLSGAYATLRFESAEPMANIVTYGDALWWALNICSVGDASLHPVTVGGRITGALLIVIGYGCFALNVGIVTAVVGAFVRKAEKKLK